MMWQYNYTDELYHYGVPGMKWGHRRAARFATKASRSRASAKEWDAKYRTAKKTGNTQKAEKFAGYAKQSRRDAKIYDQAAKDQRARAKKMDAFSQKRVDVKKSRSTGAKFATNLLAGAFANRTYNSVIAAGGSKNKARVVTAVSSMIGGPIGHLAVSHLYTTGHGI